MKKFAVALFGAVVAAATVAWAAVAPEQVALGGVAPGMSTGDLVSVCGEPQARNGDDWIYPAFKVEIDDDRPGVVESVSTHLPNAATPAGLAVGQPESAIATALGAPDRKEFDDGETEYEFYSSDYAKKLEIEVRGGIITKISCSLRD